MTQLWDIVKPLADDIEIYKEVMDEDENSMPDSYILLRTDMSNSVAMSGDGGARIRQSDCDIILVTKGTATRTTDLHNINKAKVEEVLGDMHYDSYNLGYDASMKVSQHTWNLTINYIKEN